MEGAKDPHPAVWRTIGAHLGFTHRVKSRGGLLTAPSPQGGDEVPEGRRRVATGATRGNGCREVLELRRSAGGVPTRRPSSPAPLPGLGDLARFHLPRGEPRGYAPMPLPGLGDGSRYPRSFPTVEFTLMNQVATRLKFQPGSRRSAVVRGWRVVGSRARRA
jgi:hypothetical protein